MVIGNSNLIKRNHYSDMVPENIHAHKTSVIPKLSKQRNSAGFTLLEIMIALAIISIALTALLSLGNRTIAVHDRLQKITQATLLAQHKMSEVETSSTSATLSGEENGVFEEPNDIFSWKVDYSDTPLPSIKMVSVTVSWGEENNNETVTLDSFVY